MLKEKIANAKETNWVSEGIPKIEVIAIVKLARLSARIRRKFRKE